MSVINSMLRDLDRRHAPMPMNTNVQPTFTPSSRVVPRSAIALCVLIVLVILSWGQHFKKIDGKNAFVPTATSAPVQPQAVAPNTQPATAEKATSSQTIDTSESENRRLTESFATTRRTFSETKSIPGGSEATSMSPTVAANDSVNRLASQNSASSKKEVVEVEKPAVTSETKVMISETKNVAPVVKQERQSAEDLIAERYQLARNALAQNQPERAYELLRDSPPLLATHTDYHAVLAAVEQQLKYFSDASLRYQQLLTVDQNQASWWLGLALSLDGIHRNNEALAAYQRATQLNSLPEAARQYAAARITALNHSAEQ